MINEKSLKSLNLTEEQLQKYRELEKKEEMLKRSLQNCNVTRNAIPKIIARSDLNRVDPEHLEELEEEIRNEWKEFIFE